MIGLRGIPATYGGIERVVEELSLQLHGRGHDVTVYGRKGYVDPDLREYRGVRLRTLPEIDTKHFETASHTFLAVVDALRADEADVLHIHASGPALFAFLPHLAGMPTVVTIHAFDHKRAKWGAFARTALQLGLRSAATVPDRTIVVSHELVSFCREQFGRDVTWIPNGINDKDFQETEPVEGLEPGRFLLFLGRLVPEKGVHTLLRAFARTDLDMQLAIGGPGTHTEAYVAELEQLAALDPRVVMLGPVYDARKAWLLRNAAAVVQPSTVEGLPLVLLEAGICRQRCVVSDIPEHLEVVANGDKPLATLFPAGDEQALAQAITACLADPSAQTRADALRASMLERYDWPTIARETEEIYREAIAEHPGGRRFRRNRTSSAVRHAAD